MEIVSPANMSFSFKTILIPVDFSINSEVAINKAMELAEKDTAFHLIHVLNNLFNRQEKEAENRLQQWKVYIQKVLPFAPVQTWLVPAGPVQEIITGKTKEIGADLVVIGKKSNNSWFTFLNTVLPGQLAEQTQSAVLTVKPGSLRNRIKTVVVPVIDEIPNPKIEVIETLCRKAKIKVYLVAFRNGMHVQEGFSASPLLKSYQWLKNRLHCQIEYSVLQGYNKARALLLYAEKIEADILLLHPSSETRMGWPNRHISDALPSQSKVQVLTIQPN